METMINCPKCGLVKNISAFPTELPIWDLNLGAPSADKYDVVTLVKCVECDTVLGVYK